MGSLHQLVALELRSVYLADFGFCRTLSRLESFDLCDTSVEAGDPRDLQSLPKLTRLNVWGLLGSRKAINGSLGRLTRLESLESTSRYVGSLAQLARLTELVVHVDTSPPDTLVDPFSMTQLQRLDLRLVDFTSIAPVATLVHLTALVLGVLDMRYCDLEPLRVLTKLKVLELAMDGGPCEDAVVDLAPVGASRQLEQLILRELSREAQFGPLLKLTQLVRVTLTTRGAEVNALKRALDARAPACRFVHHDLS